MKNLKKFASIMLTLVMLVSMATTALAANVTIPDDAILENHTFTAYQIFSGREEGGVLSDVQWGTGINAADFLAALKEGDACGNKFDACTDAAAVAQVLGTDADKVALAYEVARIASKHLNATGSKLTAGENNTLADGYYLVVDTTANVAPGSAYNAALLQVVGDIEFEVKTGAPSVEKKVMEDDKYKQDGGYGEGYNDVADYTMGETVPFRLIGTVPNMANYDTYKYIFHDTLSNGLALNENSIKVYGAKGKDGTGMVEITGWAKEINGQSFTVSFADLKTAVGDAGYTHIIVEYTATLDLDAEVGLDGNPNTVYLEYSNKPDQSGAGDNNTGRTPDDKVIVFTYELDTTKIDGAAKEDGNHETLQGAEFKLQNAAGKWAVIGEANKVTGWAETEDGGSTLTSGPNGLFSVIGLDDGTYYLKETKAPTGYNMITTPIEVKITATTVNDQDWNSSEVASHALTGLSVIAGTENGTGDHQTGIAAITVANNKGATLPETGGIGTTIFYALGAALMLGAGVLLVTKKRMGE